MFQQYVEPGGAHHNTEPTFLCGSRANLIFTSFQTAEIHLEVPSVLSFVSWRMSFMKSLGSMRYGNEGDLVFFIDMGDNTMKRNYLILCFLLFVVIGASACTPVIEDPTREETHTTSRWKQNQQSFSLEATPNYRSRIDSSTAAKAQEHVGKETNVTTKKEFVNKEEEDKLQEETRKELNREETQEESTNDEGRIFLQESSEKQKASPLGTVERTSGNVGCRIAVQFGLRVTRKSKHVGTGWADPKKAKDNQPTVVFVRQASEAIGTATVLPSKIGPYGGKLSIVWTRNGVQVLSTVDKKPAFSASGNNATDFKTQLGKANDTWKSKKRKFLFKQPANLGKANPSIEEQIVGVARWKSNNGLACVSQATFTLHWVYVPLQPKYKSPSSPPRRSTPNDVMLADSLFSHTFEDTVFVVQPMWFMWDVPNNKRCCNTSRGYQVIQFARADLKSDNPHFVRGKPWGLDISKAEKERAAKYHEALEKGRSTTGKEFNPTFTNKPRRSGSGTQLVRRGTTLIGQKDAPGMTEVLYDLLLRNPGTHIFRQQFFAILVCSPKSGIPKHTNVLRDAQVADAVIYTIEWKFAYNKTTRKREVTVTRKVNHRLAVHRRLCNLKLHKLLQDNGLIGAYSSPKPAALGKMSDPDAHSKLLDSPQIQVR